MRLAAPFKRRLFLDTLAYDSINFKKTSKLIKDNLLLFLCDGSSRLKNLELIFKDSA